MARSHLRLGLHLCRAGLEYWSVALKYGTRPVYNDNRDDCHTIFLFSGGLGGVLVLLRRKEGWNASDAVLVQLNPWLFVYHPNIQTLF